MEMISSWARVSSDLSVAEAIPALVGTYIGTHSKGPADDKEAIRLNFSKILVSNVHIRVPRGRLDRNAYK